MASTMARSKLNSFSYLQIKKSCRSLDQQTKHNRSAKNSYKRGGYLAGWNNWACSISGTLEHGTRNTEHTAEHPGTSRNTPKTDPGTTPRKPGTPQNVFVKYSENL